MYGSPPPYKRDQRDAVTVCANVFGLGVGLETSRAMMEFRACPSSKACRPRGPHFLPGSLARRLGGSATALIARRRRGWASEASGVGAKTYPNSDSTLDPRLAIVRHHRVAERRSGGGDGGETNGAATTPADGVARSGEPGDDGAL
jgi:hypothetical protein